MENEENENMKTLKGETSLHCDTETSQHTLFCIGNRTIEAYLIKLLNTKSKEGS